MLEKLSFVLFAHSGLKLFALPAKKPAPTLSKLIPTVQKKIRCRIIFRTFFNFFDNSSCERLVLSFLFFSILQQENLSKNSFAEHCQKWSLRAQKSYLEKISSSKSSFFLTFSDIERNFSRFSPKKLRCKCQNIPPCFRTIILKKCLIFSRFFPNIAKRFPTSE